MASIEKVTSAGVANWLRHNNRTIIRDSNTDIDYDRSKNNYSLTPFIDIPRSEHFARREEIRRLEYAHYKELKEQFYCYNRKDVNTLVSVVVTLPKEIKDPETEERFFAGVADFLCARYGNTVSITIHKDEGKHFVLKDDFGKPLLDENQKPQMEWHEGRAHLHYTFIPTVKIDHAAVAKKKNPVKAMFQYQEKISAKERINKKELLSLHPDMNRYLNDICGISCNLNTTGDIKVVTDNRFIIAKGLSALSLKARKLLYATIAQSRIRDSDFYEYETTPKELAALWEMAPDHIYLDARVFCRELMEQVIEVEDTKSHRWKLYHLMESASYDEDHVIRIKMHKEMVDLLLGLNKSFSQPPLWTFMRFKSSYSMALWHLFKRELRFFSRQDSGGLKPGAGGGIRPLLRRTAHRDRHGKEVIKGKRF